MGADADARIASGLDIQAYLEEVGFAVTSALSHRVKIFSAVDAALEWTEDLTIRQAALQHTVEHALELRDMSCFAAAGYETLTALEACMEKRTVHPALARSFCRGDAGDDSF